MHKHVDHSQIHSTAQHHRSLFVAVALYLTLALVMTWPLALYLTRAVPGNAYDSWQNLWNLWWLRWALLNGENPYFTPMLYYPQGAGLWLHTLNPINFLITLPISFALNLTATYNVALLASLTLCGLCTYLLARDVTDSPPAALVAGVVFACSGYLLAQVMGGHTHMVAAWPLPLAMLALRRAVRQPSQRTIALAGLALWINMLADWQYFLFALIWTGWYSGWLIAAPTRVGHPPTPAAWSARLRLGIPTAATEGGPTFRQENSVDLADLLIPSQLHPLWGPLAEAAQSYKANIHIQSKTVYLSVVALALAALGLHAGRESGFWTASVGVFILLAMGPELQIAGWRPGIPLPSALLFELPFIGIFRYPMRFIAVATISLAILAAFGVQTLLTAERTASDAARPPVNGTTARRRTQLVVLSGIALLTLDNLTVPFPLVGVYLPDYYREIARDPGSFAVMEAPLYSATSPFYMLYQTVHQKPLVGGYTSRRLPYAILDELPLLRVLSYAKPAPDIIQQEMTAIAPSVFGYFNIRYLMLHSAGGALRYHTVTRIAEAAGGPPLYRDVAFVRVSDGFTASGLRRSFWLGDQESYGSVLIYRLTPPAAPMPFLGVGAGWSGPTLTDGRSVAEVLDQARWTDDLAWLEHQEVSRTLAGPAHLIVYSAEACRIRLRLRLDATRVGRLYLDEPHSGQGAEWRIQLGMQTVSVELALPAGKTTLRLTPDETEPLRVWGVSLDVIDPPPGFR